MADVSDPTTSHMRDISDVPVSKVNELREWFRMYKTAEGKGENKFGLEERAMPRVYTQAAIQETHEAWHALVKRKTRQCEFKKQGCWVH